MLYFEFRNLLQEGKQPSPYLLFTKTYCLEPGRYFFISVKERQKEIVTKVNRSFKPKGNKVKHYTDEEISVKELKQIFFLK